MMIIPTSPWEKAMRRAITASLKATKRGDGTFRVPSQSAPGTTHTVELDQCGRIAQCDCKGWERFGRKNPCKHAGAVAIALSAIRGDCLQDPKSAQPAPSVDLPVQSLRGGRSQLFAPEAM